MSTVSKIDLEIHLLLVRIWVELHILWSPAPCLPPKERKGANSLSKPEKGRKRVTLLFLRLHEKTGDK